MIASWFRTTWVLNLLAAILGFIALSSWAISSPVSSSPDDDYHLASIWCANGYSEDLCRQSPAPEEVLVPKGLVQASLCFANKPDQSANCQFDLGDLSAQKFIAVSHVNSVEHSYPDGFYSFHRLFASSNVIATTLLIREINALIAVLLISTLIFAYPRKWAHVARWGWIVSLIPLGMFIIPSTNPSSWSVISAICLIPALLGIPRQENYVKRLALVLVATVAVLLGVLSRNDSVIYVLLSLAIGIFVSVGLQIKRNWKFMTFGLSLLVFVLTLYFVQSRFSGPTASALTGPEQQVLSFRDIIRNLRVLLPDLWTGPFGTSALGWLDTWMPTLVSQITLSALLLVLIRAFTGRMRLRTWVGIIVLIAALFAIPSYAYIQLSLRGFGPLQARYIYPLLVALISLLLFSSSHKPYQRNNILNWIVVAGLSVANATSLFANLYRYVSAANPFRIENFFIPQWWWTQALVGPLWVGIIGTLAYIGASLLCVVNTTSAGCGGKGLWFGPWRLKKA